MYTGEVFGMSAALWFTNMCVEVGIAVSVDAIFDIGVSMLVTVALFNSRFMIEAANARGVD